MRVDKRRYRGWLLPVSHMTKRQAQAKYDRIRAENIVNGNKIANNKLSTKKIFAQHEAYLQTHKQSSYKTIQYMFKRIAYFQGYKTITDSLIKKYQKKRLADGVLGSTINRELELAKAAFNRALRGNQVVVNPFVRFDKFTEVERTRYLTQEELKALLGVLKKVSSYKSPHLYEIVLTAIYTGMRLGEILNLHKGQIDFDMGIITIKAIGTRKYMNHKVIPAPILLLDIFREKLKTATNGYVFENPYTEQPHGNIRKGFVAALKKAGIKDFRFHDLRHTFATYALMATKDIRAVQTLLGHTDVRTTQRYAHVLIAHKVDAMSRTTHLITTLQDN